ncbi:MAG: ABC transporter permease subunit [Enterocloster clostridioformis]
MQTDTKAGAEGGVREFSRKRRLMNQAGSIVMNPYNIMVVISVIFMVYLILIPLGQMIIQTLTLAGADAARVDGGREGMFTLYYWKRVLTSSISRKMLWTPLKNSLLISVCTAAFGITLGSLLAWLMVRSDLPYKKFFSLALIIPYMIPSWCKSMAWLTIFKNERVGGAQGLLGFWESRHRTGWPYGPFAIIVVLVIHYYAYAYLLVSSALSSISSELEEMGEITGSQQGQNTYQDYIPAGDAGHPVGSYHDLLKGHGYLSAFRRFWGLRLDTTPYPPPCTTPFRTGRTGWHLPYP